MYKYDSRTPGANKYVHSETELALSSSIDDPNLSYIPLHEYDKWQAQNSKEVTVH